jgi:transcription elongation factor/antiterminator RfaH
VSTCWYVMQSKPHKESQLCAYLESNGFEVFYPTIEVKPVNPRSARIRPLFPRYLFVHADLDEVGMSELKWVPFAIGLVQFDGYAAPVRDDVIRAIRRQIEEIDAAGGLPVEDLKKGDRVRISEGPLAGYEALFDMRLSGSDRVQVLLEMLGRQVKTQIPGSTIEKKR